MGTNRPAHSVESLKKHSPPEEYLEALGLMVHLFAGVEEAIATTLVHAVGLKPDMGRAILSGIRADGAKSILVRVFDVQRRPEEISKIGEALDQFGVIASVRNDLLHHGQRQSSEQGFGIVKWGHKRERDVKYAVTVENLYQMASDLFTIHACLSHYHWHDSVHDGPMIETLDQWRSVPWQYKRPSARTQKAQSKGVKRSDKP